MKPISGDTPRKNIQVGGVILSAPMPFEAGDVLEANEAASINQTYLENVGNNIRTSVTKFLKKVIAGGESATDEQIKDVTEDQVKKFDVKQLSADAMTTLQSILDKAVETYKMGVRRSSSVEVLDPETREARALAKARLKKALTKRGIKLNTVSADWWSENIDALLFEGDDENEAHPKAAGIWAEARRRVAEANQLAADELDDLDVSNVTESAGDDEGEEGEEGEGNGDEPTA